MLSRRELAKKLGVPRVSRGMYERVIKQHLALKTSVTSLSKKAPTGANRLQCRVHPASPKAMRKRLCKELGKNPKKF